MWSWRHLIDFVVIDNLMINEVDVAEMEWCRAMEVRSVISVIPSMC